MQRGGLFATLPFFPLDLFGVRLPLLEPLCENLDLALVLSRLERLELWLLLTDLEAFDLRYGATLLWLSTQECRLFDLETLNLLSL